MNYSKRILVPQKESGLVFDYFFSRARGDQIDRGYVLIASNPKAVEIYCCIEQTLVETVNLTI
jgi:hypothetical protein